MPDDCVTPSTMPPLSPSAFTPLWQQYPLAGWLPTVEAFEQARPTQQVDACDELSASVSPSEESSLGWIYHRVSDYFYVWSVHEGYLYPVMCKQRANLKKAGHTPTIGDWVRLESVSWTHPEGQYEGWMAERLPRRTHLLRPHVSNMDAIGLVVSLEAPAFSLRQLTRQLCDIYLKLATQEASASPYVLRHEVEVLLLLSKQDLFHTLDEVQKQKIHTQLAYLQEAFPKLKQVWLPSYETSQAEVQAYLMPFLSGKVCALVGESGVGKSTLLNALDSTLNLKTAQVSDKISRGKHTTRTASLLPLKGIGGWWIDTPGFSQLSFEGVSPHVILQEGFPDLRPSVHGCQFQDCLHDGEEGCGFSMLSLPSEDIALEIPSTPTTSLLSLDTGLNYRPKRRHFVAHKKRQEVTPSPAHSHLTEPKEETLQSCLQERLRLWHDMLKECRQRDTWEKAQQDKKGFEGTKKLGKGEDTRVKLRHKQRETSRRKQAQALRLFHGEVASEWHTPPSSS